MNTPRTAKAAVTAQEIAMSRQALEALALAPPAPAPETITLASGIQELAAKIRGLMKAGYPLEQIAACIKLGGIEMKAPKLRRYLALSDKRGTKATRVKKPVPTTKPTQRQPQSTQQVALQGTTPTPSAAQTRPTTNPSANPATATSAITPPVIPPASTSRVVPPASSPAPTAAASLATPPAPPASPASPQSVPANAPQRNVPAMPAITQPVAVPSTIRPQNPASPAAPRAPTPASYPQANDANGRSASASRSGDMPTADKRFRDTALLRQTASNVRAQASGPVSAEQAAAQTQTGAPTVPPRNPDTLF